MQEGTHRIWDLVIKGFAIIATLIGIYAGYQQFFSEWELNNRKPYLEIRTKYYLEMIETVSKIAFPESDKEQIKAANRFLQLFVGVSAIVEDKTVEEKVGELANCVTRTSIKCDDMELEARALTLAGAIRKSLLRSWNVNLEEEK